MGKITSALIIVFVIEVALVFFSGTTYPNSILYTFLMNPTGWSTMAFYLLMLAILTGSVIGIVSSSFYQINQFALFAIAGVVIITFVGNIIHLWNFINAQLGGILNDTVMGGLIASLITAPLIIFYLVAVVEWTRQN